MAKKQGVAAERGTLKSLEVGICCECGGPVHGPRPPRGAQLAHVICWLSSGDDLMPKEPKAVPKNLERR